MRPTKIQYGIEIAKVVATRSECPRRRVGAVITDERGRILSTGYNGVAPGQTPCTEKACPGACLSSGEGLEVCHASHAEISALVALEKPFSAAILYVTTAPCKSCVKALLLTSIHTIYYAQPYKESGWNLWAAAGRRWYQTEWGDV
jgi:dCMP deaminase